MLDGGFDLIVGQRPHTLGDPFVRPGVQVHGVEKRSPDIQLDLVERRVADPDRT
jgi:hypothetical protein